MTTDWQGEHLIRATPKPKPTQPAPKVQRPAPVSDAFAARLVPLMGNREMSAIEIAAETGDMPVATGSRLTALVRRGILTSRRINAKRSGGYKHTNVYRVAG